ncbi:LytTR family DNA-binding domain-containing protein [Carboxylicivirga sp. M1479]|uniref:LytR/AlgR family response regulator transcription factor n=1 Tax=Carboxylicivirga sp. M1479 TaxID=2594476 RepID=UPI0011775B02|nr:LytTR family DNA-binding domain-containing protein [Carboxylicivirga sp. M1479]TRX65926.1 response regulator transcription factor [Carboxylicivirga sp. M1479]
MDIDFIIVEDEIHSGEMLRDMIQELRPKWQLKAMLQSVSETVEYLNSNKHPQIIFLDIELADGNCFSIFDQVRVDESGIIFTTAYNEFALKAFNLNSIDYLLKPIKTEELERAIGKFEKAIEVIGRNNEADEPKIETAIDYQALARSIAKTQGGYRKRFLISKRESFFKLRVEDIAYFYFDARVTFAVAYDGRQHVLTQSLDKLEEELNPEMFFRSNRQTIVNVDAIDTFESYFSGKLVVKLTNKLNDKIMISRAKASAFKEWMNQ